jgi:hypothetical protein
MAEPKIKTEDEEEEEETEPDLEETQGQEEDEAFDDLFDGEEKGETLDEPEDSDDVEYADVDEDDLFGGMMGDMSDMDMEDGEDDEVALEGSINNGIATLATFGIDKEDGREDLEKEFKSIAESFDVGKHGARFADKYMKMDGEVDPAVALLGSMTMFGLFAVQMRPDSEEITRKIKNSAEKLGNNGD